MASEAGSPVANMDTSGEVPAADAAAAAAAAPDDAAAAAAGADADASDAAAAAGGADGETVTFRVVYAKQTHTVTMPLDSTVGQLKAHLEPMIKCPAATQKLMFKGLLGGPNKPDLDAKTLREKKITKTAKILVVGATAAQLMDVISNDSKAKAGQISMDDDREGAAAAVANQKWCEMKEHRKMLDKGMPDDLTLAYRPGQDPLPETPIVLYNQAKGKVRMWVKMDQGMLVLGTKERTQKVPLGNIQKIKSEPIAGHEEYHILCLQLGPTEKSAYYLYWMPAQYISALKGAIMTFSPYM